jgi:SAM-dependent methyltransferase
MASRAERAQSFGAIAGDYDRLRPPPAEAAVDWLVPDGCQVAVDLGAGTGLLTRALARRVPHVVAVEPDERMRAVLQARSPGVEVLAGRGEAIPLPDASADGVFISSAWHWMDPELALAEITRVLRDGGRFGLIWTSRDREVGWLRDLGRRRGPDTAPPDEQADWAPGRRPRQVDLPARVPLVHAQRTSFSYTRMMTVTDFVGLQGTYSGVITASAADRAAELARARVALEERFPGAVEIAVPMRSECWRADRASRAV